MSAEFTAFSAGFRIPVIAAPMTGVSGIDLVAAATGAGIGGSFPTHNAGSTLDLDRWLDTLAERADPGLGPVIPNLIVHRSSTRLPADLEVVCRRQVPAVITSVGSPHAVVEPLHEAGVLVLSDVASVRHAQRAIDAGVDGLVLLTAGAGGQTGWANPLAFIRAVRAFWDGPLVLAGGVADGTALLAALVAGCDLAYMGTGFIAARESLANQAYKGAVIQASLDDIQLRSDLTGLPTNMIRTDAEPATKRTMDNGYDAAVLETKGDGRQMFSAGHSAAGVTDVQTAEKIVQRVEREFRDARDALMDTWNSARIPQDLAETSPTT